MHQAKFSVYYDRDLTPDEDAQDDVTYHLNQFPKGSAGQIGRFFKKTLSVGPFEAFCLIFLQVCRRQQQQVYSLE